MTFVDVLTVILLLAGIQLGLHVGLVRQVCITIGLLVGIHAAAYTQWLLTHMATVGDNTARSHLYFWMLTAAVLLIVVLFFDLGLSIGRWLHHRLEKFKRAEKLDTIGGAVVAGLTVIIVIWLGSNLFLRSPNQFVASQVRGSYIINGLKKNFPKAPEVFALAGILINPNALPAAFAGAEPPVAAGQQNSPDMPEALQHTANMAAPSVVKVTGVGCGGQAVGTGFVAAENVVITNAHVIAGITSPFIVDHNGQHPTQTILFDPRLDIAILRSETQLAGKPLVIQSATASNGENGITMGYASGNLVANGMVVKGRQQATGYDIYDNEQTSRSIYALNATIEAGDSGGPVINAAGEVIGTIFAKSASTEYVGYALTGDQVADNLKTALARKRIVSNGQCGGE